MKALNIFSSIIIAVGALLIASCAGSPHPSTTNADGTFDIRGVWIDTGDSVDSHTMVPSYYGDRSIYKIYTDTMVYKFVKLEDGLFFPATMEAYELRADSDTLYTEGHAHIIVERMGGDVFNMRWNGAVQLWRRTTELSPEQQQELMVVADEMLMGGSLFYDEAKHKYLIRILDNIHMRERMVYLAIFCLLLAAGLAAAFARFYRRHRRMARALEELQEEQRERPALMVETRRRLEEELSASEWYASLHGRLADGHHLAHEEWVEVERQVRSIHPAFRSRLYELYPLSETEYRVCLLLKLRIAPSDIATALCKDASTISSIRSRLYTKVFGKKGSSKAWDEFVAGM